MEKKIYLIFEHCGSYEDYSKELIKAFFDKNTAKEFKQQKIKEAEELKERFETKCCNCAWGDKYCELYSELKDENNDCKNRIEWYEIDDLYYTLEEIEVE